MSWDAASSRKFRAINLLPDGWLAALHQACLSYWMTQNGHWPRGQKSRQGQPTENMNTDTWLWLDQVATVRDSFHSHQRVSAVFSCSVLEILPSGWVPFLPSPRSLHSIIQSSSQASSQGFVSAGFLVQRSRQLYSGRFHGPCCLPAPSAQGGRLHCRRELFCLHGRLAFPTLEKEKKRAHTHLEAKENSSKLKLTEHFDLTTRLVFLGCWLET